MRIPAIYETWIVILLSQNILKKKKTHLKDKFYQIFGEIRNRTVLTENT